MQGASFKRHTHWLAIRQAIAEKRDVDGDTNGDTSERAKRERKQAEKKMLTAQKQLVAYEVADDSDDSDDDDPDTASEMDIGEHSELEDME